MIGYSFKVEGIERKAVVKIISKAINQASTYEGPPSFAYKIGCISIDRSGRVTAPVDEALENILTALSENGEVAEVTFTMTMKDHTGISLRNLINIISSKEKLLNTVLGRSDEIIPRALVEAVNAVKFEETEDLALAIKDLSTGGLNFDFKQKIINFSFYNGSLEFETIKAYVALSTLLDKQARKQKYSSFLQKEVDNEKYAMRCWLLRLGMIGNEYKTSRKILLEKLTGNCSFRTEEALQVAILNRKTA